MSRMLALVLCLSACAPVDDHTSPIGLEEARALAAAASDDDWEAPMNDLVLERLQHYTASESSRRSVDAALVRRAEYADLLEAAIASHGLPSEVEAVVLVESGYRNIAARPPELPAGGLWQVIPETGRRYGLRVDAEVDERQDPVLVTEAALTLLGDLHAELGDWGLAFAAYHQGSEAVREAIEREGTDDVWTLIRREALAPYAADVMAAVIVLEEGT